MNTSLIILYFFELLPLIAGIIYWQTVKNSHFKWFVIYLAYIFVADMGGGLMMMARIRNEWYYDYFVVPVEFLFYFWLFHREFYQKESKRLPVIFTGIYLLSLFTDAIYFSKHRFPFYSVSYSIGNLLLLILILVFFIQLINSDAVLTYKRNRMFWIATGLLIFFLGSFPYYGLKNTFAYNYPKMDAIYNRVAMMLDCIMYFMFTFSFIWGKLNSRSSL